MPRTHQTKLNPRQMRAIDAYFENGFKKRDAMLAAGFTPNSAIGYTQKFFNKPLVVEEIERRLAKLQKKHEVTLERLIQEYAKLALMDLSPFYRKTKDGLLTYDFSDATPEQLAMLESIGVDIYMDGRGPDAVQVKKFRVTPHKKIDAMNALMRHFGGFNDKLEVAGEISLVDRIQAGRKRVSQGEESEE